MAKYAQVYKGEMYQFDTSEELFSFTKQLMEQNTDFATNVGDKFTVTIL